MKKTILALAISFLTSGLYAQNTMTISPSKDNTIYSESGSLSNGSGQHLFVGRTNGGNFRRALIAFDIAGALQPGDSIISATLKLQVNRVRNSTSRSILMHRLTIDWGEGASDASGEEGQGATAAVGDATWSNAFFGGASPVLWTNQGGDYDQFASEDFSLGGTGSYDITGNQLTEDVRNWFNNPSGNFGWILIGDETSNGTAKRFASKENSSNPIVLEITYSSPVSLGDKLESEDIQISPNPVENGFALDGVNEFESLQIIDLNGKLIKEFARAQDLYDISDLQRGIYLLKVSDNQTNVTKKIVKQ